MKIFQKFFQLMKQEEHGFQINYKKSILKICSFWPFSRGVSYIPNYYTLVNG